MDKQKYTISVHGTNDRNSASYKTVSKLLGCNYLEAREKVITGFSFTDIPAKEAMLILKALTSGKIEYTVDPQYPHDLSV